MVYESFKDRTTKSGYSADEVISALQKEIRRGNVESACFFGLELLESGEDFQIKLWNRMLVISVEDIDDYSIIPIIRSLRYNFFDLKDAKKWDKDMQVIKAIKVLCESKKSRIVSELYDLLSIKRKKGFKIEIPDYALDMHTKAGRAKGRGFNHFFEEAAKVNNTNKNIDAKVKKELMELIGD